MNLLLEKGARRKAAPQLMLDLDWDETAHPRAEAGAKGKYKGGEFTPKATGPAPKMLTQPVTRDTVLKIRDFLLNERNKLPYDSKEFKAIDDFGSQIEPGTSHQHLALFLANSEDPLAEKVRQELGLETEEKPGYSLKRVLLPRMSDDDYDTIGDLIENEKGQDAAILKDTYRNDAPALKRARERIKGWNAVPFGKGKEKLEAWMLAQPEGDERVNAMLGQIGDYHSARGKIHTFLAPDEPVKLREGEDAPFGDPHEQWMTATIRSPYFKRWFGDWENDPANASKVVDPENGEPAETWELAQEKAKGKRTAKPVFHGSGRGGFHQFDFSKTNPDGLVGPGFYFTEDPTIAEDYLGKEAPTMGLNRDLTDADMATLSQMAENTKAQNQEDGINASTMRLWADMMERAVQKGPSAAADFLVESRTAQGGAILAVKDQLGIDFVQKGAPTLYSCYLNIRQPWDADRKLTRDDIEGMAANWPKEHADSSSWAGSLTSRIERLERSVGKSTVQLFSELHADGTSSGPGRVIMETSGKWAVVKALQAMGYDGLTHIGGNYAASGKRMHRVWVAWEPTQIKSNKDAEGTFDPQNPDIFKGKRKDAGPQLVMTFDEDAHPRAAVGTTGKYHGGEFVPKEQAPARLFHDTYTGPRYTYGLHNRPASYGNIPDGWINGSEREHPDYRHGVVDFPRELTPDEVKGFELEPVIPDEQLGGLTRAQWREAKRFVGEMEGEGGWSPEEAAQLAGVGDAYRAGTLGDYLQANRATNDFAQTLADNMNLKPAEPARRPINERDRGIASEYLSDKMGVLEEGGEEPESSLHILRRAFLAAAKSAEALDEFLQIPAVRENPHIAKMLKLMDAMDPGDSASPQAVRDRFGLRAIHFGDSLTPNEKQNHLGAITGALSLLSRAVGLPEDKLGLSNHLGLAIMAAMGPGVRAAYSPSSRSIQIDSYKGESLAHEWFHALDDALGRQAVNGNYMQLASRMGYGMWNREASPEVFDAFANLIRSINLDCPQWMAAAKAMDQRQFGDNHEPYWSGIHEMCARGFAAYVRDKWALMGTSRGEWNTYLMGNTEDYDRRGPDAGMTPPGMEKKVLNEKFDALFAALAAHPALLKALWQETDHSRASKGSKDPKHKGGQFVPKGTGSKAEEGQESFDFDADDADLDNTLSDLEEHGETGHLKAQEDQEAASDPEEGGEEGGEDKPRLNRPLTDDETHAAAHLFGQARNEVEESGDHEGGSWMQAHNGLKAAKQGPAALAEHLAAAGDEDPHAAAVKAHLGLREGSQPETPEPASAEREYQENGIRAAGFKQWFGDWEKDPAKASKVVNKAGEPEETHSLPDGAKLVFHGTSHGGFKAWDPDKVNHNGLYGGGFYFTEDESVAKDYTDKGKTYKLSRALTDKDMPKAEKWLGTTGYDEMRTDVGIQRSWKSAVQAFKEGPEGFQTWLESDNNRGGIQSGILKKLKIEQEDAGTAQVYSCYLNIRQPLDVDAPVSMQDLKTFWSGLAADHPNGRAMEETDTYKYLTGKMRLDHRTPGVEEPYQPSWADLFSDAADSTSPQFRGEQWKSIYPALKGMGFDGITHIGGGRYNANDGHRHRVWIAFQPEQIKAADNAGTFDAKDPDIYKGLPRLLLGVEL